MIKKYTYEEVLKFVKENSSCELLSKEYINSYTKLKFKCKCGNEFTTTFSKFKHRNKRQCNECSRKGDKRKQKYTYYEVKKFVEKNSNCKLISNKYINCKTKLLFECGCGNQFYTTFDEFKNDNKRQCNKCGVLSTVKKRKKTHEYFVNEIKSLVGNEYIVLGEYMNDNTKILIKHNKCGYSWEIIPSSFLRGVRCPMCQHRSYKKTTEEFKKEVYELVGDEYEVLGEYRNCETKILMRHNRCGNEYLVKPKNFRNGRRCPKCSLPSNPNTEKRIENILSKMKVVYERQKTFEDCINPKTKIKLKFDFAVCDKDSNLYCLIEYDGKQHFEPIDYFGGEKSFKETKFRDEIKNNYCKQNNIKLIRIPYWDFSNLEEILEKELEVVNSIGE